MNYLSRLALLSSALFCAFVSACYFFRFDPCAAVTAFPAWAWTLPGLLLAAAGLPGGGKRYDIWSPGCWKAYADDRRRKRSYMKAIASELGPLPADTPVLVGGDFNVPAGDGSIKELAPLLRDAYKEGGTGHGNTAMNDLPVHRFDQLWVSRHFRTVSLIAKETRNSDHRMVIADFSLQ